MEQVIEKLYNEKLYNVAISAFVCLQGQCNKASDRAHPRFQWVNTRQVLRIVLTCNNHPICVSYNHFIMLRRQLTLRLFSFLPGGGSAVWWELPCTHWLFTLSHRTCQWSAGKSTSLARLLGFNVKTHVKAPVRTQTRPQISICWS